MDNKKQIYKQEAKDILKNVINKLNYIYFQMIKRKLN